MRQVLQSLVVLALLLTACDPPNRPIQSDKKPHSIQGRDGQAYYQVETPSSWKQSAPLSGSSLEDTTKPIAEFLIEEPEGSIRITIHNFPSSAIDQRIPPAAQISRWKSQIKGSSSETPVAHDGFAGFFFEANGEFEGKASSVAGWAMQLAPQHYQAITSLQPKGYDQMRADYTIKAVGPTPLMKKHQQTIQSFAESFRLIEEIPTNS